MTKAARQAQLLQIVRGGAIRTQRELLNAMASRGVEISQVTLSRDLRELGLVKTAAGYREPNQEAAPPPAEGLMRVLREFLIDVRPAQNLAVLRTKPGGAGPVAVALDRAAWPEVVGTVAGDDTIFVATPSIRTARALCARLTV